MADSLAAQAQSGVLTTCSGPSAGSMGTTSVELPRPSSGTAAECADEKAVTAIRFQGHRRRLPPTAQLFAEGDLERERWAEQAPIVRALVAKKGARRRAAVAVGGAAAQHPRCSVCKAVLPTPHLLDIHISELHDSFFAAQAARKMEVFRCLVEGCQRKFSSATERKQHLVDRHAFPPDFRLESMHLRQKHGQQRPQRVAPLPNQPGRAARRAALRDFQKRESASEDPSGAGPAVRQLTAHLSQLTTAASPESTTWRSNSGEAAPQVL